MIAMCQLRFSYFNWGRQRHSPRDFEVSDAQPVQLTSAGIAPGSFVSQPNTLTTILSRHLYVCVCMYVYIYIYIYIHIYIQGCLTRRSCTQQPWLRCLLMPLLLQAASTSLLCININTNDNIMVVVLLLSLLLLITMHIINIIMNNNGNILQAASTGLHVLWLPWEHGVGRLSYVFVCGFLLAHFARFPSEFHHNFTRIVRNSPEFRSKVESEHHKTGDNHL